MKTPISVHALFHTLNIDADRIYSELYGLLCRDVENPLSDGLDIPVYYCKGDDQYLPEIVQTSSVHNLYLVFIDINMFCSKAWRDKVSELVNNSDGEKNIVIAVKQYELAFSMNKKLGETQSIVLDSKKEDISLFEDNNWKVFTTRLLDLIIRVLKGYKAQKPLTVFISHTKKGKDENGENYAKELRDFLASDTKLHSFFDVHDILDGYNFGSQITKNVSNSVLLILFTNTYSSREWCRIEVLTAKENKVPIVAVSMLNGNVDRVFPYIGNIPSTIFQGDWREVINLLLRTALDQCNESALLKAEENDHTEYLPYPPEAFNMSTIKTTTTKLLYPEPPLGNEELRVLKGICNRINSDISFATPISHLIDNANFKEAKIGISVSDSPNLQELGIGKEMFKDLTIELSRHILKANGRMIYGGNLDKDGFTTLFRDLSYQYGQKEKADSNVEYFDNYLSWPLYNNVTTSVRAKFINSRINLIFASPGDKVHKTEYDDYIKPTTLELRLKYASSLTSMRKQMIESSVARIIVGGKVSGFSGYMAGVVDEFILSVEKSHPVFVVGGFGGAAQMIAQLLEGNVTSNCFLNNALEDPKYKELYEWCESNGEHIQYEALDTINFDILYNGLSKEENIKLLHSVDIIEIVSLILKGLKNIIK